MTVLGSTRYWDPTISIPAMATAPSLPILFLERSTLVTAVFFCRKSNEKTWLAGANWGRNAWKRCIDRKCSFQEPLGENEARILTASPLANSAQPLSVICLFKDISKLVRPVFTCKKSIEKAWLAAVTGVNMHQKYVLACGRPFSGYKAGGETESLPLSFLQGLLHQHRRFRTESGLAFEGCCFPAKNRSKKCG